MMTSQEFTDEQKIYFQGFAAGSGIGRSLRVLPTTHAPPPVAAPSEPRPSGPEAVHHAAQDRFLTAGKKLCNEELTKRRKHPLDMWDDVREHAEAAKFPKGTDIFCFKFHGLFYVAPAQDAYMCRLRLPAGIISAHQLRGVADLAEQFGGGYADVTTRANLQIREIRPENAVRLLGGLHELGIVPRGSGADNLRNITASPTAGIDPRELIDTRPLARELHHYILHHRELYGLPRKFNIAFDGGGAVSSVADTNDIGFVAVRLQDGNTGADGAPVPPGVYFRMQLGGITGHQDFARDTGLLLEPRQCLPAAVAAVRAFIDHGDRTDRKKARLKYVLDRMGLDGFVAEMHKHLPAGVQPRRVPLESCELPAAPDRLAHIGVHAQKQPGLCYVGVVLPVGRMTVDQMRGVASIAERFGSGTIRLTVWQNLLISDIPVDGVEPAKRELESLGLGWSATAVRAGLVACTGNTGCRFSSTDTKRHAVEIADYLDARSVALDTPVNIHLTGCPHSCAQHYIGDVGLLGTKVAVGDDMVEGYHLFVGGGCGPEQNIGREVLRDIIAADVPRTLEGLFRAYLERRRGGEGAPESFQEFTRRHSVEELREMTQREGAMV